MQFTTLDDPAFVLGMKLYHYETRLVSQWEFDVFERMEKKIQTWLHDYHRTALFFNERVVEISVDDHTYYMRVKGNGTSYRHYEWMGDEKIERVVVDSDM